MTPAPHRRSKSRSLLSMCFVIAVMSLFNVRGSSTPKHGPTQEQPRPDRQSPAKRDVRQLEQGALLEREITGGDKHIYTTGLRAKQFLQVEVEQRGINLAISLTAADGKKPVIVDLQGGNLGKETLWWEVQSDGIYEIEVAPVSAKAAPGKYTFRGEVKLSASAEDKMRESAEVLLLEAKTLQREESEESAKQVIKKRQEAADLFRKTNDKYWEAYSLINLGAAYFDLGDLRKTLEIYNQSLAAWKAAADQYGEAFALNNIGIAHDELGEPQEALDAYNQALKIRKAIGDRRGEANTLSNIGLVYYSLGEGRKAIEIYDQTMPVWKALGDLSRQADTFNNYGIAYNALGEKQKALDSYNQALPLYRAAGDRGGEARTLGNIGNVYSDLGNKQKALDHYNQALASHKARGNRLSMASTLSNIGNVYNALGVFDKALEFYNQALQLAKEVGQSSGQAITLTNIGIVYSKQGEKQKALDVFNQALSIRKTIRDRLGEADTLNNIGYNYYEQGDKPKALDFFNQALKLEREVGDRSNEAATLTNIARVYSDLGNSEKALQLYNEALPIRKAVGDRVGEAETLYLLALFFRNRNNLLEAHRNIEAAVSIMEGLRTTYTNRQLSSTYFASVQEYFDLYIDLLMQRHKLQPSAGFHALALNVSERARARALLDTLAESGADIREGVDPQLLERERSLQQQLDAKAKTQTELLNASHTKAQAAQIAAELEKLTTEYQEVEAEIRQRSPRYAALTQPKPLTLEEIQRQIVDPNTLLLEYKLGSNRSYLWAVTPTSVEAFDSLPNSAEISRAASDLYDLLTVRTKLADEPGSKAQIASADAQVPKVAEKLSKMLIAPVAGKLGKKRLLIVADGALQYVPFGVLPERTLTGAPAKTLLIQRHEIVTLPSASTISALRQQVRPSPADKTLAVIADPVFEADDERVKAKLAGVSSSKSTSESTPPINLELERTAERDFGLRSNKKKSLRIPGTRLEGEQILALVPPDHRKEAFDFDASRATATSVELRNYRYIHIATHGFLNTIHPELSGLVFSLVNERGESEDGFLRAHDVYNLRLPSEMVVLSACKTGLGKDIKGEGLISLTRGFMYAGTPRVVVSLWSVNDKSTAELMTRFYRGIFERRLRPSQALQEAQISMLGDKNTASPYFWAPFIFQGDWR